MIFFYSTTCTCAKNLLTACALRARLKMSYIYTKEPPTHGKILVKTTLGDLDIELWSKEAPLACRNFVQLCMEGYYDNTIFHRIVRDFITQGGDPTGTGEGGESIYGHTFKDEFHSRLKFVRRGLVGSANAGPNDNGSQFFITLDRADELNKKHTLFGKVTGDTLYNLVQFNEIPTDKEDRPLDPTPHIIRTEVLQNPFDDIVPRVDPKRALERRGEEVKSQSKATKNFSLLSFGEEAEEDEEETSQASKELKIRSSHDVLKEDPKLSSQLAVDPTSSVGDGEAGRQTSAGDGGGVDGGGVDGGGVEGGGMERDKEWEEYTREREKRLRLMEELWEDEDTRKRKRKEQLQKESEALRRELRQSAKRRREEKITKQKEEEDKWKGVSAPVRARREEKEAYRQRQVLLGKGRDREEQTMELLSRFKNKLSTAHLLEPRKEGEREEGETKWMKHRLEFPDELIIVAKDANVSNEDTFDIYDPRNPLNKRRREEDVREIKRIREENRKR